MSQPGRCDSNLQKRSIEPDRIAIINPGRCACSAPGYTIQHHTATHYPMKFDNTDRLPRVTLYALQTCAHCREAKRFLQHHQVAFRTIFVDLLVGEERNETIRRLRRIN